MFVKVNTVDDRKEVLIDPRLIWKIEVEYFTPNQNATGDWVWRGNQYIKCSLTEAHGNPQAIRRYTFFVGGDTIPLVALPDDPIHPVLEKLYKECAQ